MTDDSDAKDVIVVASDVIDVASDVIVAANENRIFLVKLDSQAYLAVKTLDDVTSEQKL